MRHVFVTYPTLTRVSHFMPHIFCATNCGANSDAFLYTVISVFKDRSGLVESGKNGRNRCNYSDTFLNFHIYRVVEYAPAQVVHVRVQRTREIWLLTILPRHFKKSWDVKYPSQFVEFSAMSDFAATALLQSVTCNLCHILRTISWLDSLDGRTSTWSISYLYFLACMGCIFMNSRPALCLQGILPLV